MVTPCTCLVESSHEISIKAKYSCWIDYFSCITYNPDGPLFGAKGLCRHCCDNVLPAGSPTADEVNPLRPQPPAMAHLKHTKVCPQPITHNGAGRTLSG